MNRRFAVGWLVGLGIGVALLGLPGGFASAHTIHSRARPDVTEGLTAGTFAATSFDGSAHLYNAHTGTLRREVLAEFRGPEQLTDLEGYPGNDLLATYYEGMHCLNGASQCGAAKTGCGGRILKVDPASGDERTLWRVGRNYYLDGATASPNGHQIAALVQPCTAGAYFSAYLVIRRLSDGTTWTVGRKLPTCHWLSTPAWTADGRTLVVSYGASSEQPGRDWGKEAGNAGSCPGWHRRGEVSFAADHSQPGLTGTVRRPPKHCELSTPVIRAGRRFDLNSCVVAHHQGPTYIEQLNHRMTPIHSWRLSSCDNGADLALNATGQLLASTYDFCNPPLPGHKPHQPISHLYRLEHRHLVRIAAAVGDNLAWSDITW